MSGAGTVPAVERPWEGWRKRALYAVYALLGVLAVYEVVRGLGNPGDFTAFMDLARAVLDGAMAYDPAVEAEYARALHAHWATWPPSYMTITVPVRLVDLASHEVAVMGWQALNIAGLAAMLGWSARWLYGRGLSLRPGPGRIPLLALPMAVALFVPLRLVLSNFEHEQVNLLMLGLAAAGLWLLGRERRGWGGLAMALSIGIKATPVLFLPYLAWRARWRDLGAVLGGGAVVWFGIPALMIGPSEVPRWYGAWLGRTADVGIWTTHHNQSLQATLSRALHGLGPFDPPRLSQVLDPVGPALLGGDMAAPWVAAAAVLLGAAAVVAYGRPLQGVSRRREALEVGVILGALGLFSPIAWKYHYVGLVVLGAALFAFTPAARKWVAVAADDGDGKGGGPSAGAGPAGVEGRDARAIYGLLIGSLVLLDFSSTGLIGRRPSDALEMGGVVTWPALAMIVAGLWVLWRTRPAGGGAGDETDGSRRAA